MLAARKIPTPLTRVVCPDSKIPFPCPTLTFTSSEAASAARAIASGTLLSSRLLPDWPGHCTARPAPGAAELSSLLDVLSIPTWPAGSAFAGGNRAGGL